jgi:cytochrome c peroxidase
LVPPEMQLAPLPSHAPEPADNPATPAKIALGRLLFFDPILSATKTVACATCHHPDHGWTDGRALPIGTDLALLTRNAPTLLNVAFNGLVTGTQPDPRAAPMFLDNRVHGLEAQSLVPIRSREEMRGEVCAEADALPQAVARVNAIAAYRDQFRAVFGEDATTQNLPRALAAFERTLITPDTPFDRFIRGDATALNTEQQRGLKVFQDAGCILCHGGPMFSDYKLHFIGLADRRELRTPTLRQLRHTAPYMHDGSVRTIRDTLVFYEALSDAVSETLDGGDTSAQPPLDPLLKHLDLRANDFPALEAFLETLSGDYDRTAPAAVPSRLPVGGIRAVR